MDVKCPTDNFLVFTVTCNEWDAFSGKPAGTYAVAKPLKGSPDWQTVAIGLDELLPASTRNKPNEQKLASWRYVTELGIGAVGTVVKDGKVVQVGGKPWPASREFRNLRWQVPQRGSSSLSPGRSPRCYTQVEPGFPSRRDE